MRIARSYVRIASAGMALAFLLCPESARAQLPQAKLNTVFPAGGRAGDSVEITLAGTDLEGVSTLWFDHPGLRAFKIKDLAFVVAIAPGTPLGSHDIRAVGTFGATNPRAFVVGSASETTESEPNNTLDQANAIALGATVNGRIGNEADADWFAFDGKRGDRLIVEIEGTRIDSRVRPTLRIHTAAGIELAQSQDAHFDDPFLDVTLPADGKYLIKVQDVVYSGSPEYVYRLKVHDGPWIDAAVPSIVAPGRTSEVALLGRNLGGARDPGATIEGRPIERKMVSIAPPPLLDPDSRYPSSGFLTHNNAGRLGFEYRFQNAKGLSNPIFIALAHEPVVNENEPNDDQAHAQTIAPGCVISGSFDHLHDVDLYRFQAKKGEVWWIEAVAERHGSPADPTFVVQKVLPQGDPQDLIEANDWPDQGGLNALIVPSVDAIAQFNVPDDGLYQIQIHDLYNSQRGDPRLAYQLEIRRARPDFRLLVMPVLAGQVLSPTGLTLRAGGRASANVIAWRIDGFSAPIRIEATDLPQGVHCDPITMTPSQSQATLVFWSDESAQPTTGFVRLIGRGRWRDRKDILHAIPGSADLGPDLDHEVAAVTAVWPPPNPQAAQFNLLRLSHGLVASVVGPAPLSITARPARWVVPQGHLIPIDAKVTRRAGFVEAVNLSVVGLAPNMAGSNATIAKEAKTTTLPWFVPKNVPPGTYTLHLSGGGAYPFNKDPNAKNKPNINLNELSNPIELEVLAAPLGLSLAPAAANLTQGGELTINVAIARQNNFKGPAVLSLTAPDAFKLSASPVAVAADQTSAKLVLKASPESPPGATSQVAVRAVVSQGYAPIEIDEPIVLTIQKK